MKELTEKQFKLHIWFIVLMLSFLLAPPASACLMTQPFKVVIDDVYISRGDYYNPSYPDIIPPPFPEAAPYFPVDIGQIYYGTVTYDNSNIPKTGAYSIGYNPSSPAPPPVDEIQYWSMKWNGPIFDRIVPFTEIGPTMLHFIDGKLSGIDVFWHDDIDVGPEDEYFSSFQGDDYFAYGFFPTSIELLEAGYYIHGDVIVPEPATIILLGPALIILAGVKRRFKG